MLKSRHLRILILRKQSGRPVHFNGTDAAVDYVMSKEHFFWRGCLTQSRSQSYHMEFSDNWILYPKISWLIIVLLVSMKTVKLGHTRHTQPLAKPKFIQISSNIIVFSSDSRLYHIESQQLVVKS